MRFALAMEGIELVRVFREAMALIASPERWLSSGYATDDAGRFTPVGSPSASRFSTTGAILRACRGSRELYSAARRVLDANRTDTTPYEALSHAQSLALIERAIAAAGGRAGFVRSQGAVADAVPTQAMRGRSRRDMP